ncbi:hypothetical protein JKF63_06750 [Porcisia hertigi]|uniref:Ubiquinone biosynthesis protein n=1 Tax=Porcisia hertigi TaxID=2761500 RepID=A0A836IYR3_9TRYP|nr:hypothetical protein JKF63_06750 [Porcisia hertigi]
MLSMRTPKPHPQLPQRTMCAALSPAQSGLRAKILSEAAKDVCSTGFTNAALVKSLKSLKMEDISDRTLSHIFSRGFPIALVEHIVKSTNAQVQQELESAFNKDSIIQRIDSNVDAFVQNRLLLPTEQNVVERAILSKVQLLTPLVKHWPSAVALEYLPSNVPYTLLNVAEFVDTTAYYMERVVKLGELLELARRTLQSKAMASHIQHGEASSNDISPTSAFLKAFLQGVPLSSGPYGGHSALDMGWYFKRAQIALLYGTAITSLLGDISRNAVDTQSLTRAAVDRLF